MRLERRKNNVFQLKFKNAQADVIITDFLSPWIEMFNEFIHVEKVVILAQVPDFEV